MYEVSLAGVAGNHLFYCVLPRPSSPILPSSSYFTGLTSDSERGAAGTSVAYQAIINRSSDLEIPQGSLLSVIVQHSAHGHEVSQHLEA